MALTGFLVPFASGALIKRQEIADEYDETAGEIIDAASEKYNLKFDQNQSQIELQNANFAAVEASLGTAVAEVAAKNGLLNNIKTALVLKNVKDNLTEKYIKHIQRVTKDNLYNSANTTLATGEFITSSATYKTLNFDQAHSASFAAGHFTVLSVLSSDLTTADLKAVRSFNISESKMAGDTANTQINSILTKFTTVTVTGAT